MIAELCLSVSLVYSSGISKNYNEFKTMDYQLNSETKLPPVDCPLIVKVGDEYQLVERTSFVKSKDESMEYALLDATRARTGEYVYGRYQWSYP